MFERNSEKHVCRICGAAVQKDKKICECCEESFALCDLDNLLNTKTAEPNGGKPPSNAFKKLNNMVK